MNSSLFLLERSRIIRHNLPRSLIFLRHGGGPRTSPRGLNKWQWKRLHENQARDRIRSNISDPKQDPNLSSPNFKPVKTLADRFMKDGAEDLWNENDGPVNSGNSVNSVNTVDRVQLTRIESNREAVNFKKLVSSNLISSNRSFSKMSARNYSRFSYRKNESSSSDEEGYVITELIPRRGLSSIGNGNDSEEEDDKKGNVKKVKMSSAALAKYDIKKTKRIPLKFLEDEDDLSLHVQAIRNEVNKRRMAERDEEAELVGKDGLVGGNDDDNGSILSSKRFDECNVSLLTIKALTLAGYVQMTKVQEATISACLEGKDVLVKAKTGTGKSAAFLLPAIETVIKASIKNAAKRVPPICVLILCPTRELASQIAAETNLLLKFHEGIGVQTLVGGTRFKVDQKRLETEPCQVCNSLSPLVTNDYDLISVVNGYRNSNHAASLRHDYGGLPYG